MLVPRVLNSITTRAVDIEGDIGGNDHKAECSTGIGAEINISTSHLQHLLVSDKFVSYRLLQFTTKMKEY